MNAPAEQSDLNALSQRVRQLRDDLNKTVNAARGRRNTMLIVLAILILVIVGYLWFVYAKISDIEAQTIIELVWSNKVEPALDETTAGLGPQLAAQAPRVIAQAEVLALEAPQKVSRWAEDQVVQSVQSNLGQLEERLATSLIESLETARETMVERGVDPSDRAQMSQVIDQLPAALHERARAVIERAYREYVDKSSEMVEHLNKLAKGEALSQKEQIQRDILVTAIALLQRMEYQRDPLPQLQLPRFDLGVLSDSRDEAPAAVQEGVAPAAPGQGPTRLRDAEPGMAPGAPTTQPAGRAAEPAPRRDH